MGLKMQKGWAHSPYILTVINTTKCPHCVMPAKMECVGRVTHEARLIQFYVETGFTVDEIYAITAADKLAARKKKRK